jgi:4-amino-4-deoxy-L-arabinose transferase-like glycosyltransferase
LKTPFLLFGSTVLTPERLAPRELVKPRQVSPTEAPHPPGDFRLFADSSTIFRILAVTGLTFRVAFVILSGGHELTFHSGGSDAPAYLLLAQNLLHGQGFAYAGLPSAIRPPGYPLLLAAFLALFGAQYLLAIRSLQFVLGILTVGFCTASALRIFGLPAARMTLLAALFLPTLIFTTAQVLTECLAAALTAIFLYFLAVQCETSDIPSAWGLGWTAGLASLVRFNAAALPIFAACAVFRGSHKSTLSRRLALTAGIPLLLVTPWLIRNELAFHGQVLYTTQTGPNAVQGVLTSEGRTQPGDTEKLMQNLGWELAQLETNTNSRLQLPSEAVLDKNALLLVPSLWASERWHTFPLLVKKLADFWLSLDQVAATGSFPLRERLLRFAGVAAHWIVLLLAVFGWRTLRHTNPGVAQVLLIYAVGFTLLHLPLVMNTRLRIPLIEPLLVILAGAGYCHLAGHFPQRQPAVAD